jgi:hypothetical protein
MMLAQEVITKLFIISQSFLPFAKKCGSQTICSLRFLETGWSLIGAKINFWFCAHHAAKGLVDPKVLSINFGF